MSFSLGDLLLATLFFVNAIAILNEHRFLVHVGFSSTNLNEVNFGAQTPSVKSRLITLISSVQTLLRIPLIAINAIVILYELVLG